MTGIASPEEIQTACHGELHPMALKGLTLFDSQDYWHAHEALEAAWLEEPSSVRHLYRGILQAGVVDLHAQRRNYRGVIKVYRRCRRWLDPFPDRCRGLDIGTLRADLEALHTEVHRLGPERMGDLDQLLFKPVQRIR